MDKYYIPTIEEFHVGFEYEHYSYNKWNKDILNILDMQSDSNIDAIFRESFKVRVKYLDIDDINELGWTAFGRDAWKETFEDLQGGCIFNLIDKENDEFQLYYNNIELIEIYDVCNGRIFSGTIKNKSELKVLMKQLRIIK